LSTKKPSYLPKLDLIYRNLFLIFLLSNLHGLNIISNDDDSSTALVLSSQSIITVIWAFGSIMRLFEESQKI
jgi:hypothetical protein